MSTSAPISGGEEAFAYFYTTGLPLIVERAITLQGLIFKLGDDALSGEVASMLSSLLATINETALQFTGVSIELIVGAILATHAPNRPQTASMEQHITSQPGPLGLVRVGIISELERIVNPSGYETYWRAQEFGTGTDEIPTQIGRTLYGTFEPSGARPDLQQRGLRVGRDLAFYAHMGDGAGPGTISVDLPGRHFLRDGATAAGRDYVTKMAEVQRLYLQRFAELLKRVRANPRPRTFRGIIRA